MHRGSISTRLLVALALVAPLACLGAELAPAAAASEPASAAAAAEMSPVRRWERLTGIDTSGWRLMQEAPTLLVFRRPDGIFVQLDVLARRADHDPYLYDQLQAQDFFRDDARRQKAGLVEVRVQHMAHGTFVLVTTKAKLGDISPQQPDGLANAYTMVAVFPMAPAVGEIRLFAVEGQPSGMREAIVFAARHASGKPESTSAMTRHDPYDARFDATATYMDSDARQWDRGTPWHPLTRIRALMPQLMLDSKLADVPQTVVADLAAESAANAARAAADAAANAAASAASR